MLGLVRPGGPHQCVGCGKSVPDICWMVFNNAEENHLYEFVSH